MKIGKTIVSSREKAVSESERLAQRKKEEKRKKMSVAIFFAVLVLFIVVIAGFVINVANERKKDELPEHFTKEYKPTVEIIDEDGSGYITDKIKTAVGMLEEDFQDLGYKVVKAIVPTGTTREIDVYLNDVSPYFKIHIDRNTAESAEDSVRMINYLEKEDKKASYIDVRIAGRAYWKEGK
jgi:cell division septal protein FtsQ